MANKLLKRKEHKCRHCMKMFQIMPEDVVKERIQIGYDIDYYSYFIYCPNCNAREKTSFSKLPFAVKWHIIKRKLKKKI